ncbi:MAG: hypothetical protein ABFD50_20540 [Smithella sp.]
MSEKIPAETVLNTYQRIEDSLHSVLQVVPYCENHKQVWSDYLVTVILEACSLLDSLWRAQSWQSSCVQNAKTRNDLKMLDYFKYYGEYMEPRWVVFWAEEPVMKYPYKGWSKTGKYKTKDDQAFLDWWTAYNSIKHDRLQNRTEATLHKAVRTVSALFLAILRCDDCRTAILQAGWLTGERDRPECYLGEDSPSDKDAFVAVETKLFTYAVGWGKEPVPKRKQWPGPASDRFIRWFYQK